jgi:hypothetical protein
VRRVARQVEDAVEEADARVVVLDLVASGTTTFTVVDAMLELGETLAGRGVDLWFANLAPRALAKARQLPDWDGFTREGRLHETSLAAMRHFQRERNA